MAMTRRRSRLEIYLDILKAIKNGINKPTRIMYATNLSWTPLQEVLESMLSQNLIQITENNRRKKYFITKKGEKILRYFNEVTRVLKIEHEPEIEL